MYLPGFNVWFILVSKIKIYRKFDTLEKILLRNENDIHSDTTNYKQPNNVSLYVARIYIGLYLCLQKRGSSVPKFSTRNANQL